MEQVYFISKECGVARKERFGFPFQRTGATETRVDFQHFLEGKKDEITSVVSNHFHIYDSKNINGTLSYYVSPSVDTLDDAFDKTRIRMKTMGLLITLLKDKGELVLYVFKSQPVKKKSLRWNITLFVATILTTVWAGTLMWASYSGYDSGLHGSLGAFLEIFEVLSHPSFVLFGAVSFAFPILLILGLHEAGHYIASKRNHVDASLPFFIPIPPIIGILGTFGAFITIKEPLPSKKALMQIGAAGPIVGFIVAIPVTIVGFILSSAYPGTAIQSESVKAMVLGEPLLYKFISSFFTVSSDTILHPTAFAGWVGLLVTAFNLLPAGQLDGGHIARALFGKNAKFFSYFSIVVLLVMGFWYPGWFIFAFLILFFGVRHPPPLNDISPLKVRQKIVGIFSIFILVVCFIPIPLTLMDIEPKVPNLQLFTPDESLSTDIGGAVRFEIILNNTGNGVGDYHFSISLEYERFEYVNITELSLWNVYIDYPSTNGGNRQMTLDWSNQNIFNNKEIGDFDLEIPEKSRSYVNITVHPDRSLPYNSLLNLSISGEEKNGKSSTVTLVISTRISTIELFSPYVEKEVLVSKNIPNIGNFGVTASNVGAENDLLTISIEHPLNWSAWIDIGDSIELSPGESISFFLRVQPPYPLMESDSVVIELRVASNRNSDISEVARFTVNIREK